MTWSTALAIIPWLRPRHPISLEVRSLDEMWMSPPETSEFGSLESPPWTSSNHALTCAGSALKSDIAHLPSLEQVQGLSDSRGVLDHIADHHVAGLAERDLAEGAAQVVRLLAAAAADEKHRLLGRCARVGRRVAKGGFNHVISP